MVYNHFTIDSLQSNHLWLISTSQTWPNKAFYCFLRVVVVEAEAGGGGAAGVSWKTKIVQLKWKSIDPELMIVTRGQSEVRKLEWQGQSGAWQPSREGGAPAVISANMGTGVWWRNSVCVCEGLPDIKRCGRNSEERKRAWAGGNDWLGFLISMKSKWNAGPWKESVGAFWWTLLVNSSREHSNNSQLMWSHTLWHIVNDLSTMSVFLELEVKHSWPNTIRTKHNDIVIDRQQWISMKASTPTQTHWAKGKYWIFQSKIKRLHLLQVLLIVVSSSKVNDGQTKTSLSSCVMEDVCVALHHFASDTYETKTCEDFTRNNHPESAKAMWEAPAWRFRPASAPGQETLWYGGKHTEYFDSAPLALSKTEQFHSDFQME